MSKKLFILSIVFTAVFAIAQVDFRTAKLYKDDINSTQAFNMQQKDALIIDVRTKREFQTLRAKDSINIPVFFEKKGQRVFNQQFLQEVYLGIGKNINKKIILICRSGSRTKLAANLLAHNGFSNVYNIKNGFSYDWMKVKLPTEK